MTYLDLTVPNYSYVFNFEEEFVHQDTRVWMIENWKNGFYYVGIYMILIFGGQHYMQSRPRFQLRGVLVMWNTALACFSILGACRTLPELLHTLKNHGVYHSVCIPSYILYDKVSGFWTWMFVLSKLPELGDTVFIVLRKQPLIFLHWYHHITVLLYSWFSYAEYTSSARWYVVMNYLVHSVMYTYYALRAMGYRPPKQFAMFITASQLSQMVVGCLVNYWAYQYLQNGDECHISLTNIKLSFTMYLSYAVLFARFFHKSYLSERKGNAPPPARVHSAPAATKYDKTTNGHQYGLLTGQQRTKVE
ncbi:elongation of very long chain fatty acids protein 6 [Neocloeon triangulifer]|uniref:elongation of very long chain fatty acids protein 6 n=1 Tax=Neocloeon triangulifer TaxID=2078957 RepID=UPI00286F52E9|nr:elongation of very long chain fatty acids protein 6 [Neocloeon triangulifer]XP_059475540.1 elongation of very long chain fatty acids protein 6 [Neocloeon triangulifer]